MAVTSFNIGEQEFAALQRNPEEPVEGRLNGSRYGLRIAIPNYSSHLAAHYAEFIHPSLREICRRALIPFDFQHFGLICEFDRPTELDLYDQDMILDDGLRRAVHKFGPVTFKNAHLGVVQRGGGQRNIFPDLKFRYDRGNNTAEQYSLFIRDPFDPVQRQPRESSTLVAANIAVYLQHMKENDWANAEEEGIRSNYDLFKVEPLDTIIGKVLYEQRWDAPAGIGEISVLFNRTVLHASYYRPASAEGSPLKEKKKAGYPIGVRYLI